MARGKKGKKSESSDAEPSDSSDGSYSVYESSSYSSKPKKRKGKAAVKKDKKKKKSEKDVPKVQEEKPTVKVTKATEVAPKDKKTKAATQDTVVTQSVMQEARDFLQVVESFSGKFPKLSAISSDPLLSMNEISELLVSVCTQLESVPHIDDAYRQVRQIKQISEMDCFRIILEIGYNSALAHMMSVYGDVRQELGRKQALEGLGGASASNVVPEPKSNKDTAPSRTPVEVPETETKASKTKKSGKDGKEGKASKSGKDPAPSAPAASLAPSAPASASVVESKVQVATPQKQKKTEAAPAVDGSTVEPAKKDESSAPTARGRKKKVTVLEAFQHVLPKNAIPIRIAGPCEDGIVVDGVIVSVAFDENDELQVLVYVPPIADGYKHVVLTIDHAYKHLLEMGVDPSAHEGASSTFRDLWIAYGGPAATTNIPLHALFGTNNEELKKMRVPDIDKFPWEPAHTLFMEDSIEATIIHALGTMTKTGPVTAKELKIINASLQSIVSGDDPQDE